MAPTRLDPFTGMSLSTKVLEYAAMDKPVVASRLPTVERYFDADTLAVYEPGDHESLAATILKLSTTPPGGEPASSEPGARGGVELDAPGRGVSRGRGSADRPVAPGGPGRAQAADGGRIRARRQRARCSAVSGNGMR